MEQELAIHNIMPQKQQFVINHTTLMKQQFATNSHSK